jgi:hypothetical protein
MAAKYMGFRNRQRVSHPTRKWVDGDELPGTVRIVYSDMDFCSRGEVCWFDGTVTDLSTYIKECQVMSELRRKLASARAELTPNKEKRDELRAAHDEKYGMCHHGNHKKDKCPGDSGR